MNVGFIEGLNDFSFFLIEYKYSIRMYYTSACKDIFPTRQEL